MPSARYQYVEFTSPTHGALRRCRDLKRVVATSWQQAAHVEPSEISSLFFVFMFIGFLYCMLPELSQEEGKKVVRHREANIHVLRLTRIRVCPQLVRQLVCVLCSSRLPWLNRFPLYASKRPVSKMNLAKDFDQCYILVSLVTAWIILYLPSALLKKKKKGQHLADTNF